MTTNKKMTKHEMREDHFVTGVFKFQEWAEGNLSKLLIGGGIVIAVIVVVVFMAWQSSSGEKAAFDKLGSAEVFARTGQTQLAVADFQEVMNKYSNSEAASQAAFKLAGLYFQTNDFANAELAFKNFHDKFAPDDVFRRSAQRGIAASQAGQGKFQEAGIAFLSSAKVDTLASTYEEDLLQAVTNSVKANDAATAKEAFALLEKRGTTSDKYRNAKILLIERGILAYDKGEYK
ncbi:MAG: tetratricopeptide repeat protein [bacterium]|nr:tetratricopeptide repeat protein [bacterium]